MMPPSGLSLRHMESGSWRRPVSLQVEPAEIVMLLGRNGAGKTTLLNTIAGLLPVRAGSILFSGIDVTAFDEIGRTGAGVRLAIEGRQIFGRLSVRKNLLLGAFTRRDNHVLDDLKWVLSMFPDLESKLGDPAASLSGGQQTQLNVGRALMGQPRLLLLDEPALGLDPRKVASLISTLRQICQDRRVAVIIAEQSGQFARAFNRRVVLMVGGEIAFDGPLECARADGRLAAVMG